MFPYNLLGRIEKSTARFRRRSPWLGRPRRRSGLRDKEHLGVSGERYIAVSSQILLLCNLQRSLNALGLHRHAETSSAASYLDRVSHHLAFLCTQTVTLFLVHANIHVMFCMLDIFVAISQQDTNRRKQKKRIHSEQQTEVRDALLSLPEAQRIALELAYFNGMSQSEIAESLHEPLGTIKTRMQLGMKKLRDRLGSGFMR